jgi:HlyD family secretion protein
MTGAPGESQPIVRLQTVWPDTVKQGDMKLEVHALGRVTSSHTAALNVAETQMENVRQGEPAIIAFPNRKETFRGKVAVVHPEVANGKVTVDVVMGDALPPGISPQEPVDGTITTGELTNVVYVGRPVFGQPNSQVMLFRIEPGGRSAKKIPVQFGAASVNLIEIRSGLQPGDRVILSDMSQYDRIAAIVLR